MKRRLAKFGLVVLPVIAAASGLTGCGGSSDYAAEINGKVISTQTVLDELHTITSNPRYVAVLDQQLGGLGGGAGIQPNGTNTVNAQYTAQLVFNRMLVELIDQSAEKENAVPTPAQTADAERGVRSDLGDPALYESLPASYRAYLVDRQAKLAAITAKRDTPLAQQQYYDSHLADFTQYCVSHILVTSPVQSAQLRKQIVDDGGDFGALAKQFSIDNQTPDSSAVNGGALGCFKKDELEQFIEVFRDATLAQPVGEVSQPVQSQFGYHLIKVTAKNTQTFAEAQPAISQELSSSSTFLQSSLDAAKVKVNPRFGVYQKADPAQNQSSAVIPPPVRGVASKTTVPAQNPSTNDPTAGGQDHTDH